MDQQLKDVGKKIDKVEKAIDDLRSARPEGWQDELSYLRNKEKQLREEKNKLREEKLLLLPSLTLERNPCAGLPLIQSKYAVPSSCLWHQISKHGGELQQPAVVYNLRLLCRSP